MECISIEEVSLRSDTESLFAKTLLIAAGSSFEYRLTKAVYEVFLNAQEGSSTLASFVWNMAINRRYHTWFNWSGRNANGFFGSFGPDFQAHMQETVGKTDGLTDCVVAFLELGNLRNALAHDDLASYALTKTVPEVVELYNKAKVFVEMFPIELRSFLEP
ncbi:MAG: HEPN domain-containing protein [Chloroflexota bacterium]|nr:HEPN domain-containing protein [Chloroflexota bacterium]